MHKDLKLLENLNKEGFSKIQVEEILNYLETLDYDLECTRYVGTSISKNERLAKYFFLRDKLRIQIGNLDEVSHVNEIFDQCVDWSEFWRLLVIKKGFCCIGLAGKVNNRKRYVFLYGPNILSGPYADIDNSIHDHEY